MDREIVAKALEISLDDYNELENGQEFVDAETSTKLSLLYIAPPQVFLAKNSPSHTSVIYTHCSFNDSFGYVNHNYQNDNSTNPMESVIIELKNEIKKLRNQNNELVNELMKIKRSTSANI